jgi:hypothetical protein
MRHQLSQLVVRTEEALTDLVTVPRALLIEVLDQAWQDNATTEGEFAVGTAEHERYAAERAKIDQLKTIAESPSSAAPPSLTEALRPIRNFFTPDPAWMKDDQPITPGSPLARKQITAGDLRRLLAADDAAQAEARLDDAHAYARQLVDEPPADLPAKCREAAKELEDYYVGGVPIFAQGAVAALKEAAGALHSERLAPPVDWRARYQAMHRRAQAAESWAWKTHARLWRLDAAVRDAARRYIGAVARLGPPSINRKGFR